MRAGRSLASRGQPLPPGEHVRRRIWDRIPEETGCAVPPEQEPRRDVPPPPTTPQPTSPPPSTTTTASPTWASAPSCSARSSELGYEEPTPIQREAIPPLLAGRDLLGQAATGTGKTAAFALPILQRMAARADAGHATPWRWSWCPPASWPSRCPRRSTATAGTWAPGCCRSTAGSRSAASCARSSAASTSSWPRPAGPSTTSAGGRSHLDGLEVVVLDEADEMLDMGFAEDIEAILQRDARRAARRCCSRPRCRPASTASPAATCATRSASRWAGPPTEPGEAPLVRQTAYVVPRAHKPAALGRVLDVEAPAAALVFCRTRDEVDQLTETLNGRGYRAEALHGGMTQEQRDRVMGRLRGGTADLLVATDVAARGLDIDHLTHVVNYDVPSAPESYVHRIGRVGRAGREGVAITLAEPREHRMLKTIERVTGQRITVEKVPTVADLRARRLELTRAALEESILEDDLDRFRVVVETLTDEFDVMEVALAAVKLAHEASGAAADEEEIPDVAPRPARDGRPAAGPAGGGRAGGRGGAAAGRAPAAGMTRLFIGAGRARDPAAGPGRGDRRRDAAERPGDRGDRDRRPVLAGGGAGGGGRRGHRRPARQPRSRASARRSAASATRCR